VPYVPMWFKNVLIDFKLSESLFIEKP